MFPIIDLIASIGSLIVPPAFDFIKKKFVKGSEDTPERTISSLATTKPEVLPEFTKGVAELKKIEIDYFNRDVIGEASRWVVNLRASIRPITVVLAIIVLSGMAYFALSGDETFVKLQQGAAADTLTGVRLTCETIVGSWFGNRVSLSK